MPKPAIVQPTYFVRIFQDVTDPETYVYTANLSREQAERAAELFALNGASKVELCSREFGTYVIEVLETHLASDYRPRPAEHEIIGELVQLARSTPRAVLTRYEASVAACRTAVEVATDQVEHGYDDFENAFAFAWVYGMLRSGLAGKWPGDAPHLPSELNHAAARLWREVHIQLGEADGERAENSQLN